MKLTFILLLSLTAVISYGQDTTKIEQYCELVAQGRLFSPKVTIDINFGEAREFFSDNRMRDEITGKVKLFNSVTDALNFMGTQGWSLVNAFPISTSSGPQVYHFYFKKLFLKSEVMKNEKN